MIIRSRTKAYQKTPRSFLYNYSDSDRVWLCYINRHLQSCLTTLIAVIPHFVWFFRRKFPKIITAKIPFRPAHIVEGCSCTRDLLIGTAELNRALCEKDSEREQPEADVEKKVTEQIVAIATEYKNIAEKNYTTQGTYIIGTLKTDGIACKELEEAVFNQ